MKKRKVVIVDHFDKRYVEEEIDRISKGKKIINVSIATVSNSEGGMEKIVAAVLLESK